MRSTNMNETMTAMRELAADDLRGLAGGIEPLTAFLLGGLVCAGATLLTNAVVNGENIIDKAKAVVGPQ
jgi:hypothetical protein